MRQEQERGLAPWPGVSEVGLLISGCRRVRGFVPRVASRDQGPRPVYKSGPCQREGGLCGALESINVRDLSDPQKFSRFGREPVAVDILPGIDGVAFDEAWERRVEGVIDAASGLTAFFISKADLIALKLAAGRTRDLADVEDIREVEASSPSRARSNSSQIPRTAGPARELQLHSHQHRRRHHFVKLAASSGWPSAYRGEACLAPTP
jgi:hypothetical protein